MKLLTPQPHGTTGPEIWKPIPGFVGFYEASNLGRIRSFINNHNRPYDEPKVLKLKVHGNGKYLNSVLLRKKKLFSVHALVLLAFVGPRPKDFDIDHIDGDGCNNRLSNLRYCTRIQNLHNRHSAYGFSKYNGVTFESRNQQWRARMKVNGKSIHIGCFKTELEAANAYKAKQEELFPIC